MRRVSKRTGAVLVMIFAGSACQVLAEPQLTTQVVAPSGQASTANPTAQDGEPPGTPSPEKSSPQNDPKSMSPSSAETRSTVIPGSGSFIAPVQDSRSSANKGNVSLNFVGVNVQDVAKAILGDMLGLNYSVDPSAQGVVSVETTSPVRRDQVLAIFETSLEAAKLALVQKGSLYSILPLATAQKRGVIVDAANAGYGSEAVTLHYVNAAELKKTLDPLVPDNGITQSDTSRNVLFVTGSKSQRESVRNLIRQFDVNWLKGMSFALFVPQWSDAQSMASQLTQILGGEGMPTIGLIRIVPIPQVNGVLVITSQADYLERARQMVETLDREGEGNQPRLFVYHVQNGRAADLAAVLSASYGGSGDHAGSAQAEPTGLSNAGHPQQASSTNTSAVGKPGSISGGQAGMPSDSFDNKNPISSRVLQMGGGKEVTITADETTNALVIRAVQHQYEIIQNALHKLDVQPLQVMIQAAITEVTLNSDLNYGVQWYFQQHQNTVGLTQNTTALPKLNYPGFSYFYSNGAGITATLNALSDVTKINVLSSPELFVLNNHTATLQVGDQVPISTQSSVSTDTTSAPVINSIEYRDTGVILKVTPRVNDSGLVLLDIAQEVSDVATTNSSKIDSPTIQQRRISSSLAVQDGQTIALGGLITDRRTKEKTGIPYLNNIPLLGELLGSTNDRRDRTELLVLLTPHVVRNRVDADAMTAEITKTIQNIEPLASKKKAER